MYGSSDNRCAEEQTNEMSEQQIKLIRKENRTDIAYYIREHGIALLHLLIPMFLFEAEKIVLKHRALRYSSEKEVDKQSGLT